jgi:hypothetical protein
MSNREIRELEEILDQTVKLILLYEKYKKYKLTIPFALKGNIGEFIVVRELLKRYPAHKINYKGGAFPGVDIILDNIKIQIKTQFKPKPWTFKRGETGVVDFESAPTIKKSTFDKDNCNIIILMIIYFDEARLKIEKENLYIFNEKDFNYFSPIGCWSGKSKGDKTIFNILRVTGKISEGAKIVVNHYNTPEYKKLFDESKNAWGKIDFYLS